MTAYETTTSRLIQQELGACALIQDLLPLYLEGEVSPASRDLIGEHLSRCEHCAGFLAGARSVREQLRRESALRETSVERDHTARQAIVIGQRRVMALGVFGLLFLFMAATALAINLVKPTSAIAPEPIPVVTDMPISWPDRQLLEADLHRRAMEEAGRFVGEPQPDQFNTQPAVPPPAPVPPPQP